MSLEEKVQAMLIAAPAVTSYVPASRIRTAGDWQNLGFPNVIHFPVAWEPTRSHAGLTTLQICGIYQISIFGDAATKYSGLRNIATAIIATIDGPHSDGTNVSWIGGLRYTRDEESATGQIVLEFRIAEAFALS